MNCSEAADLLLSRFCAPSLESWTSSFSLFEGEEGGDSDSSADPKEGGKGGGGQVGTALESSEMLHSCRIGWSLVEVAIIGVFGGIGRFFGIDVVVIGIGKVVVFGVFGGIGGVGILGGIGVLFGEVDVRVGVFSVFGATIGGFSGGFGIDF